MTDKPQLPSAPNYPNLGSDPNSPQYAQQQQQQQHAPAQTFTAIAPVNFGPEPVRTSCPSCHQEMVSRTSGRTTSKTHLTAYALFWLCGYFCCCFVPYCVDSCRNMDHYCTRCNAFLGSKRY